jgi:hypothetical protein
MGTRGSVREFVAPVLAEDLEVCEDVPLEPEDGGPFSRPHRSGDPTPRRVVEAAATKPVVARVDDDGVERLPVELRESAPPLEALAEALGLSSLLTSAWVSSHIGTDSGRRLSVRSGPNVRVASRCCAPEKMPPAAMA